MSITIKDIADKTNVSMSTISRVINNSGYVSRETREKVEAVIREYDYVPSALAKGLSKNSNNIVGALVPEIDNSCFSGILTGINEVCDKRGVNLMLCGTDESLDKELSFLRSLKGQRIRGLIVASAAREPMQTHAYANCYRQFGAPVVLVDRGIAGTDFDCLQFDDTQAIYGITNLLLEHGHQHVELLAGDPEMMPCRERTEGFRNAFRLRGMGAREEWIHYSDFAKKAAYDIVSSILSRPVEQWPTALVANNNMLTIGALRAILERGLSIPDDIAFVGYDQIELLEYLQYNITLAEKDTVEMGRVAMELLWERMTNPADHSPRKVIMRPRVVVRGSEAFPKNRRDSAGLIAAER